MEKITKEGVDNKVIFNQVREYFKDTLEGISLGGNGFEIVEGDLDNMFMAYDAIYAGDIKGLYNKSLYCMKTKTYATITKSRDIKVDKTPAAEEIWDSNSIQFRIKGDLEWEEYKSTIIEFRKKPNPDNSKEIWDLKCEIKIMESKIEVLKQQMI
tara:strand:+ start:91 stop:555 length:465 start_codon:yes stop_codon:yes gene_type:complete